MPSKPEPRHQVWLVEWEDPSDAFPHWSPAGKVKPDDVVQLCQSVGYLVEVLPDHLTLATSTVESDGEPHYGGGVHIPTSLVKSKRRLG
jgi:hypothetical protein